MLNLSRKLEQSLIIDGRIIVTVTAIEGGNVKLGVTAPRSIPVVRDELLSHSEIDDVWRAATAGDHKEGHSEKGGQSS